MHKCGFGYAQYAVWSWILKAHGVNSGHPLCQPSAGLTLRESGRGICFGLLENLPLQQARDIVRPQDLMHGLASLTIMLFE